VNRCLPRNRPTSAAERDRPAFTLLELLLVLAMLASLLAIAWPRMNRMIGRVSRGAAAQRLMQDLLDARESAIRSGEPYVLLIEPGTGHYRTVPQSAADAFADPETRRLGSLDADPARDAPSPGRSFDNGSSDAWPRDELPDGAVFALDFANDRVASLDPAEASREGTWNGREALRDEPIETPEGPIVAAVFHPDGRADDTNIDVVVPEFRERITIRIRGWTGGITIEESSSSAHSDAPDKPSESDRDGPERAKREDGRPTFETGESGESGRGNPPDPEEPR